MNIYCFVFYFVHITQICYVFEGQGQVEAQNNRDYTVRKMSDEIHEIIRVLQLTTYDEEEWDADDLTVMKKSQVRAEFSQCSAGRWRIRSPDRDRD